MKLFFNLVSAVVCVLSLSLIPLPAARVASAAPVSAPVAAPAAPAAAVKFAAVGDYGDNTANELSVANLIKSWSPEFVITMGDNSYGAAAPDAPAVSTIDQNIGKYYSQFIGNYSGGYPTGAVTNQFFPTIGNHEYSDGGGINAYLNYFTLPNNERYYDFVRGPVHFFALNSDTNEPDGTSSSSTQGLWLQNGLQNSTSRWNIVYFHHAPFSSSSTHGNSAWMQWPFKDWGADAVLAGHVHNYERLDKNGLPYFVNGSGGHGLYGWLPTLEPGSVVRYNANYGAMLIEANDFSLSFKFYSIDDTVTPQDSYTLTDSSLVCESFNSYTPGSTIGSYTGWYDGGAGPVVTAGNGVAGSTGLSADDTIFHWTAHPFNWNAADFQSISLQMDYQTDSTGAFDDDRAAWTIDGASVDSANQFGVQLDNANGGIVTYWRRNIDDTSDASRVQTQIVALPSLTANTWYRLRADITRLTATSAKIDVSLVQLDGAGSPTGTVTTGSVADTSTWAGGAPDARYFTATSIWPSYKNHTGAGAPADNTCYQVVTGAVGRTLTVNVAPVGGGSVTKSPDKATYNDGESVQLTPVPAVGYVFSNWSGSLTGNANPATLIMDADKTVTANFVPAAGQVCESFNGYTAGSRIGSYTGWTDGGAGNPGPVVTAGNGVASSTGLAAAASIFHWTAHPFNWNAANLQSVSLQMDYQTDANSAFDDDRVAWTIDGASVDSTNQFGVQLDNADGGIVTFWRNSSDVRVQTPIVALPGLAANTWYRLRADITKLTATSAKIDVSFVQLDGSGNPTGTVTTGSVANTSTWAGGAPAAKYFTATSMWPSYKNHTGTAPAPADNTCYQVVTGAVGRTLTVNVAPVGGGSVTKNPDKATYNDGESVQLTPVPAVGYVFSNWSGSLTGNANPATLIMDADKTVTANFVPAAGQVCESFNGYTAGSRIGSYTGWTDGGAGNPGPVVTAGNGVASSTGLAAAASIFHWTAHPFNWNAANLQSVSLQMDYQTDANSAFDDDRVAWTIDGASVDSTNQFGVQLDNADGGIVTYWRNSSDVRVQTPIVALPGLAANTWYRLRADITKLTPTSARIDVSFVQLDGSGNPTGTVTTGNVANTSSWAGGAPASKYFTATSMWPSYKNHTGTAPAPADNTCYQVVTGNSVSFQDGVSGYTGTEDTFIRAGADANTNYHTSNELQWDDNTTDTDEVALIRFTNIFGVAVGQIPTNATILAASLTYKTTDLNSGSTANGDPANVYESKVNWPETTVTWNDFGGEAGVQADEYENLVASAPATALSTEFTIDVTASLQRWAANPSTNLGWVFLPTAADGVVIYSSDDATVANRPRLTVIYGFKPKAPVMQTIAVTGATKADVTLTWDAVTQDVNNNLTKIDTYGVFRSENPYFTTGGIQRSVDPLTDTSFTDPGAATTMTNWYYLVRAHNDAGWGDGSSLARKVGKFTFGLTPGQ